jgi:hypothetical protein
MFGFLTSKHSGSSATRSRSSYSVALVSFHLRGKAPIANMVTRCVLARLRCNTRTINWCMGCICNRRNKSSYRLDIRRLPSLVRILPSHNGYNVLHLPPLLAPHQHLLLLHLLDAHLGFCMSQWRILPTRQWQSCYCRKVAGSRWRLYVLYMRVWMVDLLRYHARGFGFPIPGSW